MCSEKGMFNENIETTMTNKVGTIGGKYINPKGFVRCGWYCNDEERKLQTKRLNNVP